MTMVDYNDKLDDVHQANDAIYAHIGEAGHRFKQFYSNSVADGALSKKTKELMGLAVAINMRCEGCIVAHVKSCVTLGATIEEISETVEVALAMSGGPALIWGGKALEAAEQFLNE